MDFQLYDYTENNFISERAQDMKNSWAIPSDGSMESNEEYFSWTNDLKLALENSKQFSDSVKFANNDLQKNQQRKRKFYSNEDEPRRKMLKDPMELNADTAVQERATDKRDEIQNGWQVDEITENLTAELNGPFTNLSQELSNKSYSDALLSLPNLPVFKQEAQSPISQENPIVSGNKSQATINIPPLTTVANEFADSNNNQNSINTTIQNLLGNAYNGIQSADNDGIIGSPSSQDGNKNMVTSSDLSEHSRFQYVLAAATSIATKVNEDTLTYLNQGQSYEIKLKKLGDLSNYRGRILKSIIRICFYERRLQYMEKEQMSLWQSSRPGDRIIEVDVPLSYGLCEVSQPPSQLNAVNFLWDPTKEVGVYIKVNCISTEFTPKKHGGEKGVPFRIQVETYLNGDTANPTKHLHAAACQIKVFKLKGADRKHKQDREKIMKRPFSEQEKYQPSYDCTVLNDISNEMITPAAIPPMNGVSSTIGGPYSPENGSPVHVNDYAQKVERCATPPIKTQDILRQCNSVPNLAIEKPLPEISVNHLSCESNVQQTSQWLTFNRFSTFLQTFAGFSGSDMLRMSKDDLIQICGQAEGIRLYNSLHLKCISPKLTMYVCRDNTTAFNAIYLMSYNSMELVQKLSSVIGVGKDQIRNVYFQGPHGIHVHISDDVVQHIKEDSMFLVDIISDNNNSFIVILKPIVK